MTIAEPETTAGKKRLAQREALLDAASEMLVHGGPDSISLRKLASRVGTSTMAVYTAFGGKDGLIAALFEEAFDRLAAAESAAPKHDEPLLWLGELAGAYRGFALKNPSYYALMISATLPIPESLRQKETAEPAARGVSQHASYQIMLSAVEACIADGSFRSDMEPDELANALWSAVHGHCSLELAGFHENRQAAEKSFNLTTEAVLRGLLTPKGLEKFESFTRG